MPPCQNQISEKRQKKGVVRQGLNRISKISTDQKKKNKIIKAVTSMPANTLLRPLVIHITYSSKQGPFNFTEKALENYTNLMENMIFNQNYLHEKST